MALLQLNHITRTFNQEDAPIHVLKGVNLALNQGEIVALVGPSGSGKSTLLQIIGLLEAPTSGELLIDGHVIPQDSDQERTLMRRQFIGFVYQFHHLLPEFTALENVTLPQLIQGVSNREATKRSEALLSMFNLQHRFHHRPKKLSGGEQQRVAVARALANAPRLLLADEPTGNLDQETSDVVFNEMLKIVRETGLSAFIATHDLDLAKRMDRQVTLKNGILEELSL